MTDKNHTQRYSEAFRRQVVQEYEAGSSLNHLRRKYGIDGTMTIQKWIRRYSHRQGAEPAASGAQEAGSTVVAGSEAPQAPWQERLRWLEKAVSELTIENLLLKSTLALYQETYGDELVKKTGKPSWDGLMLPGKGR